MSLPVQKSKDHHIGSPPTHFKNPWESASSNFSLWSALNTRFGRQRNFVPVPEDREGLPKIRRPDFGISAGSTNSEKLRATWIGHASWLIQWPSIDSKTAGVTLLFDPVFSDRTSPSQLFGPKRYSQPPCTVNDLPHVDAVVISHNHYDHLDRATILQLVQKSDQTIFVCPLNNKDWFVGQGIPATQVHELDWWHALKISTPGSAVTLVCTPAQHNSSRTGIDRERSLWSSWAVCPAEPASAHNTEDQVLVDLTQESNLALPKGPRMFFAGDTGYRAVKNANPTEEEEATAPRCPAFKEIGEHLGPFDLALLPIGLYSPRDFMSAVHCAPEDSVCVHQDIKSKRTVGMHYGTVRGGISAQYEDVREPPRRFEEQSKRAGLKWGEEIGLCDIGETVIVA